MIYCLAIDIGASSGRHILGKCDNGKITCEEIFRFENGIKKQNGFLCWDIEYLVKNVIEGIKKCGEKGVIPDSVAIDTWGVDYVLLDKDKKEILPAVSYRDSRTIGIPEEIDKIISREELYSRTGIQRAELNTINQLYCDKKSGKLDKAKYMLLIPSYLTFKLTGVMKNEYTDASTTSLLDAEARDWDFGIIDRLGLPRDIFTEIAEPGSFVGNLSAEVRDYVGFDTKVLFAPAHDTASAVAACTLNNRGIYISSGTWSLIGTQNKHPITSEKAFSANFANEGGVHGTYRFLKNIIGMWIFQNIRKNLDNGYSYGELMKLAMSSGYTKTFNPNDNRIVAPENMIDAIKDCLGEPDLPLADILNSAYHSLAKSYAQVVKEIEDITGENVDCINIVGGGCQAEYLNRLTEEYTGKPVIAGPIEATALGNLKTQSEYFA